MEKYFMWIHYERLHNHNKAKHNKTVCIFLGIYCTCCGLQLHLAMVTSSNGNIFRVTAPLCGEFTGPGEFPTQRPVTRSFDVFFDLRLNKRFSKQPWGWWFETLSWSLWRHRNEIRHGIPGVGYITTTSTSSPYVFKRGALWYDAARPASVNLFTFGRNVALYLLSKISITAHQIYALCLAYSRYLLIPVVILQANPSNSVEFGELSHTNWSNSKVLRWLQKSLLSSCLIFCAFLRPFFKVLPHNTNKCKGTNDGCILALKRYCGHYWTHIIVVPVTNIWIIYIHITKHGDSAKR